MHPTISKSFTAPIGGVSQPCTVYFLLLPRLYLVHVVFRVSQLGKVLPASILQPIKAPACKYGVTGSLELGKFTSLVSVEVGGSFDKFCWYARYVVLPRLGSWLV